MSLYIVIVSGCDSLLTSLPSERALTVLHCCPLHIACDEDNVCLTPRYDFSPLLPVCISIGFTQ